MQNQYLKAILISVVIVSLLGCTTSNRLNGQGVANQDESSNRTIPTEVLVARVSILTNDISSKLPLDSLSKAVKKNDFEFRLWTNVGNFFEKILVVRLSENKSSASFFDIQRNRDLLKFEKKILSSPKSGWERFFSTIQNKNIKVPLKLNLDPPASPVRDEGGIMLEILDHGKYDFVYYGQLTSSADGKKLLDLCDYLVLEFDVDLDCLGKHTSP